MKRSANTFLAVLAWLATTLGGTRFTVTYACSPGAPGSPPSTWPETSGLPRSREEPALLMFLHPPCPGSRASLGELSLLMTHRAGRVKARVVFFDPAGIDGNWAKTDLWRAAGAIPGVVVERDPAGDEARLFRVGTSGDTLLYGADGRLLFHGAITFGCGHAGDNPARSAMEDVPGGGALPIATTPIFGRGLFCRNQPR